MTTYKMKMFLIRNSIIEEPSLYEFSHLVVFKTLITTHNSAPDRT